MSACIVLPFFTLILLLTSTSSAPTPRILSTLVTGETRGLEIPRELLAGIGVGKGAIQIVVNVHTDSQGNIEVYTN